MIEGTREAAKKEKLVEFAFYDPGEYRDMVYRLWVRTEACQADYEHERSKLRDSGIPPL